MPLPKLPHKASLIFSGFFLFVIAIISYTIWQNNLPLVSPIALIESLIGNSPAIRSKKIIYGFFPYWNLKYADKLNIQALTHFAYFAIDLNADGTINKKINLLESEPGWNKLKSKDTSKLLYQAKILGQKTILTITAMDTDLIENILNSEKNKNTAISSILSVYQDYDFDGLNIDFEYLANGNQDLRDRFTSFITDLHSGCITHKNHCQIDIDVFASVGEKPRLWDLKSLEPVTDKFIVMAYDYYRKSSPQAGPVAPLRGKCSSLIHNTSNCLEEDIITHLSLISKILPSTKIILGVPFYGYQWQTASSDFLANTYPQTGSLATYQRIQTLFQDPEISSLSAQWSDTTLSPYLVFEQKNKIYQVHFENAQSLEQKIKLIESANLGGLAIWALGYEGDTPDLWRPITTLFLP